MCKGASILGRLYSLITISFMRRIFLSFCICLISIASLGQSRARASRYQVCNSDGDILAYSNSFDLLQQKNGVPEFLQEILRNYRSGNKRYSQRQKGNFVAPLLKSLRTQDPPYNGSAPYYIYEDGSISKERCVSGCVATALEQVVSYWRHPAALLDTLRGWQTEHYQIPDVLPGTKIDWDNILTNYKEGDYNDAQAKAISDLTYYLGVASHMNWGIDSSGASLSRAFDPLYDAFDYRTVYFLQRGLFSNPAWNRLLRNELECGRPIVYTGHNYGMSGHCFVIDGVDEEGYYHVNWGEHNLSLYLDLDYMNPYEPIHDPTDMGQQVGYFTNQTALFMHPDDFEIDIHDSLRSDDALRSVVIDTVVFSREPDIRAFLRADFSLTNPTQDSINYTFSVFTYLPTDSTIFEKADYVGLTAVNLAPGEHKTWPVYCRFSEIGERVLGCTSDDKTIPFKMPITVSEGVHPIYSFEEAKYQLLRFVDSEGQEDLTARITFDVRNDAKGGGASDVYTYCLFADDEELDTRHFNILQVMGGQTCHETVDFHHLKDGVHYRYLTRQPWTVRHELEFTVNASDAVDAIPSVVTDRVDDSHNLLYDLSGRMDVAPGRGLYISRGRKFLVR